MIRNFNYTDRIKIDRFQAQVTVHREPDGIHSFDAALRLDSLKLPENSTVYVEAYYKSSYMRFHYGTVSDLHPPVDRRLTDIDSDLAFFRIKVVDDSKRLLALADGLIPEDLETVETGRKSLLPVKFDDLDDEIWQLNLDPHPFLVVNRNIEGIRELVKTSREFFGLVFPTVVRQILQFVVKEFDITEPSVEWWGLWLMFMQRYSPLPENLDTDDDTLVTAWIDQAVSGFCTRHNVKNEFRKSRLVGGSV